MDISPRNPQNIVGTLLLRLEGNSNLQHPQLEEDGSDGGSRQSPSLFLFNLSMTLLILSATYLTLGSPLPEDEHQSYSTFTSSPRAAPNSRLQVERPSESP